MNKPVDSKLSFAAIEVFNPQDRAGEMTQNFRIMVRVLLRISELLLIINVCHIDDFIKIRLSHWIGRG